MGVSWIVGFCYFQPPVGLLGKVVRKAERTGSKGLLLVPDWHGSVYCMLVEEILREIRTGLEGKFRPRIVCPGVIVSDTFRGYLKFDMCLVSFAFWE